MMNQLISVRIDIYSSDYRSAQVYTISDTKLSVEQCKSIASELLTNNDNWRMCLLGSGVSEWFEPSLNGYDIIKYNSAMWLSGEKITRYVDKKDRITEISYHPETTDNLANTLKKMIEQRFGCYFNESSIVKTTKLFIDKYEKNHEYNSLIEWYKCEDAEKVNIFTSVHSDGENISHTCHGREVQEIARYKLDKYNEENALGLSDDAIKEIKKHFKLLNRKPTDIELETLAQTWSEHCKHTIFSSPIDDINNGLYKTYIKSATEQIIQKKKDFCVSVFSDNAGAISFTENWLIAAKVETHNSPSAIEPFGGAMTGILGVNRDIIGFGKGAKPVANMYGFCFANPSKEYSYFRDQDLKNPVLQPRKIIDGVVKGVEVGGNCSGIPTTQGFVFYDEGFIAKPLVFVGTVGLIPRFINGKPSHVKKPENNDYIVIIGGHTGKDGVHGANFSSESLNNDSPSSAVQIGDPITQKKLSDALIKEARNLDLYNAITDNGAGGLSSSVGEMGHRGFEVHLEKVLLKYSGIRPWEIWVSESQERMTLSVPPEKYDTLCKIMQKHDVSISKIGTFNDSGVAKVKYNDKVILNLDTDFLHNGNPLEHLKTEEMIVNQEIPHTKETNLQGFRSISEQYDHEVQGGSILKPLQGKERVSADATVVRPVLSLEKGVAISQGIGILLNDRMDPYAVAANAVDTAIRNAIVVGANPEKIAILDNFCWSNSTDQKRLWQLKRSVKACYDYAIAFGTPFISGKDSMFNDFKGYNSNGNFVHLTDPPTLLITSIGIVDNIEKCVSLDAKFPGDLLYLLGENDSYSVNADQALSLYKNFYEAINRELIASAISVNLGGLKHAINKIAPKEGILKIKINNNNKYPSLDEYPSRILVTINPDKKTKFEKLFIKYSFLGEVVSV